MNSHALPKHLLIEHEAMKTTFRLRLVGDDEGWLRGIARECIEHIDELERKLSRFFEGGDVHRINHMNAGETLHLSEECHECLLVAMEACVHTNGLFDPTLGALIDHRKHGQEGAPPQARGKLTVSPDTLVITCDEPGKILDLGGIGKGFALDRLGAFLTGWGVESALLSSGASTHLAVGRAGWPIDLTGDHESLRIELKGEALSASGTAIQGSHIVHPDHAREEPADQPARIWARSRSAAHADAWSTALMLLSPEKWSLAPAPDVMLDEVFVEEGGRFRRFP